MQNEIPRELIAEIVSRIDLIQLVSETVNLKRVGNYMMGLCPFHPDKKSNSFAVRIGGQHFHCYGCHAAGDAITFLKLQTNRPFREIVQELADRAGVLLPQKPLSDAEKRELEQRQRDVQLVNEAQKFFVELLHTPAGKTAHDAALKRGYSEAVLEQEGLGYSGAGWEDLVGYFQKKHFNLERAAVLGLCGARQKGEGYFDRFRHRLTFPICEPGGAPVAFGGRALSDEESAKYLNSPETPLYRKSNHLFRIDKAKESARKHGFMLLTEGYFDALAFAASGLPNVVACCGTAFTIEQARLIKRYCPRVVTSFDGDRAGLKATVAAFPLLASLGIRHDVLVLPAQEDPDSLRQKKGEAALQQALRTAVPVLDFLLERLVAHGGKSVAAKSAAITRMAGYIAHLASPVEQELYRQKAGAAFGIPPNLLAVDGAKRDSARRSLTPQPVQRPAKPNVAPNQEDLLVGLMLHAPEIIPWLPKAALEECIDASLRDLARQILDDYSRFNHVLLDDLIERFKDLPVAGLKIRASRFLTPDGTQEAVEPEVLQRIAEDCLDGLRRQQSAKKKKSLLEDLQKAQQSGNVPAEQEILKQLQDQTKAS